MYILTKNILKWTLKKSYQWCAARGCEKVEDGGQVVITNQDQSETDQVQQPVDHVEPHCNYRVSQKKVYHVLRGHNSPKNGLRNKSRVIFEILWSSSF